MAVGADRSTQWFVVRAQVEPEAVDELAGALWSAGVAGIEERTIDGVTHVDVSVRAGELAAVGRALGSRRRQIRAIDAEADLDGWRAWAKPTQVGRVRVQPAWFGEAQDSTAPRDTVTVRIDPRRSFGSGAHPSTRLALDLLQECLPPKASVLDLGTGSGVLAVAAARLGAAHVVAIDVDDEARQVARANVELNDVDPVVDVVDVPLDRVHAEFDLVVANLDRPTLVGLVRDLTRRVRPTGHLVMSGFLTTSESDVQDAYAGWNRARWRREGEWSGVAVSGDRSRRSTTSG
jgi:ribosomal protein L11 methyltransferase